MATTPKKSAPKKATTKTKPAPVNKETPKPKSIANLNKITLQQVREERARQSLSYFLGYESHGDWKSAPHLELLCSKLEAVERGEILRLMVFKPPRHGKSEVISKKFPARYLGRNPRNEIIMASYSADLAYDHSRIARDTLKEWGPKLWGVNVSKDSGAADRWGIAGTRGGLTAAGVGGPITGRGANVILIDDPIKNSEEADSVLMRERLWNWYRTTLRTRLAPGGAIVLVMTRWHCILAKTPILCYNGLVNIDNIKRGDKVYTSNGLQEVMATASKEYSGDIYKIVTFYSPLPIPCTPEHKILTDSGWKSAESITKNDYIAFPILDGWINDNELINYQVNPKEHAVTGSTKRKGNKIPKDALEKYLKEGLTYQQIADIYGYKAKQTIYEFAIMYGLNRGSFNCINADYIFDPDFWWVVGIWLAEGTITTGRMTSNNPSVVRFTLGKDEINFASRIYDIMGKYGIVVNIHNTGKSTIDVKFSSYQIAEFLSKFGKGAHNKYLPDWVIKLPDKYFYPLAHGYWQGDGCYDHRIGYRFTSVSTALLFGFQMAFLKRNFICGVVQTRFKGRRNGLINGKEIYSGDCYELRIKQQLPPPFTDPDFKPPTHRGGYIKDKILYTKVKSTTVENYSGFVFDLQTPAHDFLLPGGLVHNCDDLAGRLLQEMKSGAGEQWEILNLPAQAEEGDILGRKPGEWLWPERYPPEEYEQIKKAVGTRAWISLYQQRPSPDEGGLLKRHWWRYYSVMPDRFDEIIQSWDCTFKDKDTSDYVVGQVWGRINSDKYLLDQVRGRMDLPGTIEALEKLSKRWPQARVKLIEGKANGPAVIQMLRHKMTGLIEVEPKGGKIARANAVSPEIESGNIYLPESKIAPWIEEFVEECSVFPNGKHDDMVDAMTQALERLAYHTTALKEPELPSGLPEDLLSDLMQDPAAKAHWLSMRAAQSSA